MLIPFWTFVVVAVVTAEHGWGAVVLGGLAGLVALWLESVLWPNANCLWCRGKPRRFNVDGNAWRNCPVCKGSGRRRRPLGGRLP